MSGADKPGAEPCRQLIAAIPRSGLMGAEDTRARKIFQRKQLVMLNGSEICKKCLELTNKNMSLKSYSYPYGKQFYLKQKVASSKFKSRSISNVTKFAK